jgi:hypothetical protein
MNHSCYIRSWLISTTTHIHTTPSQNQNSRNQKMDRGLSIDDAFCGGPDGFSLNGTKGLVSRTVGGNVAAIVLMGDPRHVGGLAFNAGNATAAGVRYPLSKVRL